MPAFPFTADAGSDELTSAGHALLTGDGPVAVRAVGGALPAPLAAITDYWIIRLDANRVQLAASSADALAETAIDLSTNGSGTLLLEIGIPYRRARTYVPRSVDVAGARVHSADVNAIQDALTSLHALLTGQAQSAWTMSRDWTLPIPPAAWTLDPVKVWDLDVFALLFNEPSQVLYPIKLEVGAAIKSFGVQLEGNNTKTAQIRVQSTRMVAGLATVTVHAELVVTPSDGGYVEYEISFESTTGAVPIDATAAVTSDGVYHRSTGSFIDDGFLVGMTIQPSGFAEAGNNLPRVVTAVHATHLNVEDNTGMVDETGAGAQALTAVPVAIEDGHSYTVTVASDDPVFLSNGSMRGSS